jgi:hypothetical protein
LLPHREDHPDTNAEPDRYSAQGRDICAVLSTLERVDDPAKHIDHRVLPRSGDELELETRWEAISVAWYASAEHFDEPRIGRRSDEVFERGENFRGYRAVPSMIDYLLVAHDRVRVEHYTRSRDDTWVLREHGPGSRLRPASGAGEIAIDEIYRKVSSLDHLLVSVSVSTRSSYVLDERHGPAGLAPRFAGWPAMTGRARERVQALPVLPE